MLPQAFKRLILFLHYLLPGGMFKFHPLKPTIKKYLDSLVHTMLLLLLLLLLALLVAVM